MFGDEKDGWAAIGAGAPIKGVIIEVKDAEKLSPNDARQLLAFCKRTPAIVDRTTSAPSGCFCLEVAVTDIAALDEIVACLQAILPMDAMLDRSSAPSRGRMRILFTKGKRPKKRAHLPGRRDRTSGRDG